MFVIGYNSSVRAALKVFAAVFAVVFAVSSCDSRRLSPEGYLEWLYSSMNLADSLCYSHTYYEANVAKTLDIRDRSEWKIPEREFRHFVLPLRVNNETLDDFRLLYADTLSARVAGLSMEESVLEINHWCHEQATYEPSDGRTSSPTQTMWRGVGRCGEESVLCVAALRAAGIPARQVYTPRWAHTDDNHAWVEAWVDGKWRFLGACEPEPVLDKGWFNASVSRAMLLHTKVIGDYKGPEDVIARNPVYTEINVIRNYVPARRLVARVTDADDIPIAGAKVDFCIYNYAEFYTVASYETAEDGCVALDTGYGSLVVRAFGPKGRYYGISVATADRDTVEVVCGMSFDKSYTLDFDIVPPPEKPLITEVSEEASLECGRRFAYEDSLRTASVSSRVLDGTVRDFLAKYDDALAIAIVNSLSKKDLTDISKEVLEDSHNAFPGSETSRFLVGPRVEREALVPFFNEIRDSLSGKVSTPEELREWVSSSIKTDAPRNPQGLRIPPVFVLRSGLADARSRDIFYVAAARALGWPARLEDGTGKVQYMEGDWTDVSFSSSSTRESDTVDGTIILDKPSKAQYYRNYTLSYCSGNKVELIDFDEDESVAEMALKNGWAADPGYYFLVSGTRLHDGSVLARVEGFPVAPGSVVTVPVVLREPASGLSVKGSIDTAPFASAGRSWFLVVALGGEKEPDTHALRELSSISSVLSEWGRKVFVFGEANPADFPGVNIEIAPVNGDLAASLASGCLLSSFRGPLVLVADSFGNVYFVSQGYNPALAADLLRVINFS